MRKSDYTTQLNKQDALDKIKLEAQKKAEEERAKRAEKIQATLKRNKEIREAYGKLMGVN